jgi:hypothetical protein
MQRKGITVEVLSDRALLFIKRRTITRQRTQARSKWEMRQQEEKQVEELTRAEAWSKQVMRQ